MPQEFNTLHIFGYGESQLIKDNYNKKVLTSDVAAAPLVVADVYSKKPQDNTATTDYHAVSIFYNNFANYVDKNGESFRVPYDQLDSALIDSLVTEIENFGTAF